MHFLVSIAFSTALVFAQNAPAPITDSTVVGISDGKKITVGEITKVVESLPPQMRPNYMRDPKGFLSQYFLLVRLSEEGLKAKLHEESPFKEAIQMARMNILAQAVIENMTKQSVISGDDQKKYYEGHKDSFTQAKLKMIYVAFSAAAAPAADGKKILTEKEALAKIEGVVKQAREGADFAKLVGQYSEDPISKEQGGDYGPIKRDDKLPDAIKQAIFALRPGDVSDPVRQPNGYYVFRMMELVAQPYEDVKDGIYNEMKNAKVRQWIEATSKAVEIKVERQDYFDQLKK